MNSLLERQYEQLARRRAGLVAKGFYSLCWRASMSESLAVGSQVERYT
jgi:hypothetical protein